MRHGVAAFFCALLLLAGCGGDGSGGGSSGGNRKVEPPAGGWPQATDGKIGDSQCGLLTNADLANRDRLVGNDPPRAQPSQLSSNGVSCDYGVSDQLGLDLQPNAALAGIVLRRGRDDHAERMTENGKTANVVEGAVAGADESWWDQTYLPSDEAVELYARRGALLMFVRIGALVGTKDQRKLGAVAAEIAALVLARAPDLGRTDTGPGTVVRYDVLGKGKAKVQYLEPYVNTSTAAEVQLPWTVEFTVPDLGRNISPLSLNAYVDIAPTPVPLRCTISVNGTVANEQNALNFAICQKQLTGLG
jgi:hypothetical protein